MNVQLSVGIGLNYIIIQLVFNIISVEADFVEPPISIGATTKELVEIRGYVAIDHTVTTQDGYSLDLVEILNPEIIPNGYNEFKDDVLFIHGLFSNANSFILRSDGAVPRDYSHFNASLMSDDDLMNLLENDPASKSMPYLASNFGHRVWLVSRRGTNVSSINLENVSMQLFEDPIDELSQTAFGGKHINTRKSDPIRLKSSQLEKKGYLPLEYLGKILKTTLELDLRQGHNINPKYWNYSLDEQAKYDIPDLIDYILDMSGKDKLTIVGHSNGGTLTLMALTLYPDLADKISKGILWAPALYPSSLPFKVLSRILGKTLLSYLGPFPVKSPFEIVDGSICSNLFSQLAICNRVFDLLFGPGGNQQTVFPEDFSLAFDTISSHALVSYFQGADKGKMHHFDYKDKQRNLIAYNQTEAPVYDVSRIKLRTLSFFTGVTDGLIPPRTILAIADDMRVPVERVYIKGPGLLFNHVGYILHNDADSLGGACEGIEKIN